MFFAALSIVLGGLSSTLPVTSLATATAVAVCFSPEEDCTAFAVDAIDRAETQILVNRLRPNNEFEHRRGVDPGQTTWGRCAGYRGQNYAVRTQERPWPSSRGGSADLDR